MSNQNKVSNFIMLVIGFMVGQGLEIAKDKTNLNLRQIDNPKSQDIKSTDDDSQEQIQKNLNQTTQRNNAIEDKMQIYFTRPKGERAGDINFVEIEKKIIEYINKAKECVYVHIYSFTSINIMNALLKAKNERNVSVHIIADKQYEYVFHNAMKPLLDNKVDVKIRHIHGISHIKGIAIDYKYLILGSYNYTNNANNKNDEVLIIVDNASKTKQFMDNWYKVYNRSTPVSAAPKTDLMPNHINFHYTKEIDLAKNELLDKIDNSKNRMFISLHGEIDLDIVDRIANAINKGVSAKFIVYGDNIKNILNEFGIMQNIKTMPNNHENSSSGSEIIIDDDKIFTISHDNKIKISSASVSKRIVRFEKQWNKITN